MPLNRDLARRLSMSLVAVLWALSLAAADAPPVGLPHFAQVDEHVYRGGQPSEAGITSLAKLGVKAVIDLRGAGDRATAEEKQVEALGIKYYGVPLPGFSAPENSQISTVLALMDDAQNWPVYVHCMRGKDRTGTVVACYRIRHDHWPNERAMKEAGEHGLSRIERAMRSYILHYNPHIPSSILAEAAK